MLSIAVQFEELSITRTASITDEKLGVVMTMKIDAAEVAKVFSDLKLPAAFKAYEQQLGDPGAMKLDFGDRVALILRAELASRTQKRIQRRIKESGICDSMVGLDNTIFTPDRGMDLRAGAGQMRMARCRGTFMDINHRQVGNRQNLDYEKSY